MSNLEFSEVPTDRRTKIWSVVAARGGVVLGSVAWYNHWRRYCFFPAGDVLFDVECLKEIVGFITRQMEAKREQYTR